MTALPQLTPLEKAQSAVEDNSYFDVVGNILRGSATSDWHKRGAVRLLLCDEAVYPENILKLAFRMAVAINVDRQGCLPGPARTFE